MCGYIKGTDSTVFLYCMKTTQLSYKLIQLQSNIFKNKQKNI